MNPSAASADLVAASPHKCIGTGLWDEQRTFARMQLTR